MSGSQDLHFIVFQLKLLAFVTELSVLDILIALELFLCFLELTFSLDPFSFTLPHLHSHLCHFMLLLLN